MKKIAIVGLGLLLLVAFTLPAAAMEYQFGGYWRTRGYTNQNFTGFDKDEVKDEVKKILSDPTKSEDEKKAAQAKAQANYDAGKKMDITWIDTRTRLYFTAVFNENLKFVNKFEMDAVWGDSANYGDIGADGTRFEVKNSYVDFNVGPVGGKVGAQPVTLGRGFLFDDDASAAILSFNGEGFSLPLIWIKAFDMDDYGKRDVDFFAVSPSFSAGGVTINPFGMFMLSEHADNYFQSSNNKVSSLAGVDKLEGWYGGLNIDGKFGPAAVWLTGIYQGGSADLIDIKTKSKDDKGYYTDEDYDSVDFKAWMAAAGFNLNFGVADFHGQGFYMSGDDTPDDKDREHFFVPTPYGTGQYYAWSEILGEGVFDAQIPRLANGKPTPGTQPGGGNGNTSGFMAGNLGTTISPMKDLKISLDAWYISLVEDLNATAPKDANNPKENPDDRTPVRLDDKKTGEKEIGIEANVKITYTLVPGLNIDLIGAYLFAGDAMYQGEGAADPYEFGTRLSLSF